MKRVIALLLTLVMLLGLVPTALAAEAAAPDGTVVKAEEVSGTPRLDARAENDSAAETTQPTGHQPDDMVTILVELERAPVLEGFAAKKTASTSSAGAEIAAYLAGGRAEKQDAAIRRDQKKVFAEIQAAQPAALQAEGTSTAGAPELMEQWTVLFNGMAVRAPYGMLDTIRSLKGVKSAHVQHVYSQPASPATNAGVAGYSYDMVHLQEVWNKGYTGKGMLVAVVDSGLDMEYSSWWSDEEGANVTGLRRVHEAFRDDSFYSQLSNSDLRYTKESLLAFLNGRQLNANRLSPASNEAMYKTRKVPFAFDYAGDADPYTGEIISGDVNVRTSGSLLHSGGEGSHRTDIRVQNHTAGDGICLQQHAQIGDLCKLRLVVQRRVFAHPARFIRLAAHDPIADHHIREAQTDGVKAAQRARGLLHRRCAALHLFQGRGLGQRRRVELRRLSLRKQCACGAQQPCQQ